VDRPDPPTRSREGQPEADILAALADPSTYGLTDPVAVCETHASWVFLAGPWAYKVKKPVRLAFLDYSTLALRRAACGEELRVNGELGGDIYRAVLAVLAGTDGVRFAPEGTPGAAEYVLQMRRFDERLTLAGAITDGRLQDSDLDAVARRIASFHAAAPSSRGGGGEATLRAWQVNLDELEEVDPELLPIAAARRFGEAFVDGHRHELDRRAASGLVRDGHGDLRCEHVLLEQQVLVVDRIEFDPALRRIDVGWDLAFLLMDLQLRGQATGADRLLRTYRHAGGDPGSEELVWFFAAYWALVRAKVEGIAASQHRPDPSHGEPARAHELGALAERLCWRARGPVAVVVAGPPASGKSTLAGHLSKLSGLPIVSSDVTRKRLAGLTSIERGPAELYTHERSIETYRALGEAVARHFAEHRGVVLDATCGTRDQRAELLGALAHDPRGLLFVECRVPLACALERSAARMAQPEHVSDATPEVVSRLFDAYEEIRELPGASVVAVDGRASLDAQVEAVAARADALLACSDAPVTT